MAVGLFDLPAELIDHIISLLPPCDIMRVRITCKRLNNIVEASSRLQFILECHACGLIVTLHPSLSSSDRLDRLRQRERNWRSLKEVSSYEVKLPFRPNGIYDLAGGIFILGIGDGSSGQYGYLRLLSAGDEMKPPSWNLFTVDAELVDFGLSVYENDLIVLVTRKLQQGNSDFGGLSTLFEIHFRTLSGGDPHPRATKAVVSLLESAGIVSHADAFTEIVGDLVVILLFPWGDTVENLYLINWNTGSVKLIDTFAAGAHTGVAWLSEDAIIIPNIEEDSLDIFRLSPVQDSNVPEMFICRAEPNPYKFTSGFNNHGRPFHCTPESAILLVTLRFSHPGGISLSMVIHREKLLAFALSSSEDDDQSIITAPYSEWGVQSTCWFLGNWNWITMTAGQRCVLIKSHIRGGNEDSDDDGDNDNFADEHSDSDIQHELHVLDFNPFHVKDALAGWQSSTSPNPACVVHGRRILPFVENIVDGPLEFELPYVLQKKKLPPWAERNIDAWVDEERVVKGPGILSDTITSAEVLVFG
ncbi:hypothetical protein K488DRAFT_89627 [Vararia minispora EC-137]|uniref:Uncharacterized protein n=1 Tax=Vararia minispora EC-137 TaxID=1314806 RepID=A0ACB8QA01_9AGAM|nr:hypothetical protein K488DRAFT_89627 [Vararia minispora EC-137]